MQDLMIVDGDHNKLILAELGSKVEVGVERHDDGMYIMLDSMQVTQVRDWLNEQIMRLNWTI